MNNLQSRIKKVRTELTLSIEKLAEELTNKGFKISARTIYSYESGERQPSTAFLQALTNIYDINCEWLLNGRGEIYLTEQSFSNVPVNIDLSNMVFIPLINMNASAGNGCLIPELGMTKDFIAFAKSWLTNITVTNPANL